MTIILIDIVGIGLEDTVITILLIDTCCIGVEGTAITIILIDIVGIWGWRVQQLRSY